jgi:predicted alpha/beta hydrolase family esterase
MSKEIIEEVIHKMTIVLEEEPSNWDGVSGFEDGEFYKRAEALLEIFEDKLRKEKFRMYYPESLNDKIVLYQELENSQDIATGNFNHLTRVGEYKDAKVYKEWSLKLKRVLDRLESKIKKQGRV